MSLEIEKMCASFLERHWDRQYPLLLALSGGSDSMALFHLLRDLKATFEVAHVDHAWREESLEEAAYLEHLCCSYQVPFHGTRLPSPEKTNNLEDRGRKERQAFFRQLCEKRSYAAIVLGHHADDQAETVLKRVFEGASLPKLKGIAPVIKIDEVIFWRPLLHVSKKEILSWMELHDFSYFSDPTNTDRDFLRGRLREELLPLLSHHFGKEVRNSLCRIGRAAEELDAFMEELLTPFRERVVREEGRVLIDLKEELPSTPFLLKALIRDFFSREQISLSTPMVETILSHLVKGSRNVAIQVGKERVKIDATSIILY